jgi:hypothetical protein
LERDRDSTCRWRSISNPHRPRRRRPVEDASFTARSIAGEDWSSVPHKIAELVHGKRVDEARWFALIATIDKAHPFVVVDGGEVTAPADGQLVCYFNDVQNPWFYKNNDGWVRLEVEPVAPA